MEHSAIAAELEITCQMDFLVPLKQIGLITRSVLEAISQFYCPRRIIVVSTKSEGLMLSSLLPYWDVGKVEFVDEDIFFKKNFSLTFADITNEYDHNRKGDQRESGWWMQQLIKLGAATQISDISEHYVVWDGDLVPTRRWRLCDRDSSGAVRYYIAILQGEARSEFNSSEYAACMMALTGFAPVHPQGGGTFVAHHMVFCRQYVQELLALMAATTGTCGEATPWPLLIMAQSRQFYRFSEYKTYATFMLQRHPREFHYHTLDQFGEGGLRFREANAVVEEMLRACPLADGGLSYDQVRRFTDSHWQSLSGGSAALTTNSSSSSSERSVCCKAPPAYVQLDHVYGLQGVDLRLTTVRCRSQASSGPIPETQKPLILRLPLAGATNASRWYGTVRKRQCRAALELGGDSSRNSSNWNNGGDSVVKTGQRWRRMSGSSSSSSSSTLSLHCIHPPAAAAWEAGTRSVTRASRRRRRSSSSVSRGTESDYSSSSSASEGATSRSSVAAADEEEQEEDSSSPCSSSGSEWSTEQSGPDNTARGSRPCITAARRQVALRSLSSDSLTSGDNCSAPHGQMQQRRRLRRSSASSVAASNKAVVTTGRVAVVRPGAVPSVRPALVCDAGVIAPGTNSSSISSSGRRDKLRYWMRSATLVASCSPDAP